MNDPIIPSLIHLKDANNKAINCSDAISLFDMNGKVVFERGAFGIAFNDTIDWNRIIDECTERTGNNTYFTYNDNFVSFWELMWNFNDTEDTCSTVEIISRPQDEVDIPINGHTFANLVENAAEGIEHTPIKPKFLKRQAEICEAWQVASNDPKPSWIVKAELSPLNVEEENDWDILVETGQSLIAYPGEYVIKRITPERTTYELKKAEGLWSVLSDNVVEPTGPIYAMQVIQISEDHVGFDRKIPNIFLEAFANETIKLNIRYMPQNRYKDLPDLVEVGYLVCSKSCWDRYTDRHGNITPVKDGSCACWDKTAMVGDWILCDQYGSLFVMTNGEFQSMFGES